MELTAMEKQYNNRLNVPEHPELEVIREEKATAARQRSNIEFDISYGPSDRSKYDLVHPENANNDMPLALFIHGGYWMARDHTMFTHIAEGLNKLGYSVAIPSYDLCPEVSVSDIISQIRDCAAFIWKKHGKKLVVFGHSAGGHLSACLFATDWSTYDGVPDDLITKGCAISGVFDIAPLRDTSMSDTLNLTEETARAASPLFFPIAGNGRKFLAASGANETSEFHRQADELVKVWSAQGVDIQSYLIPDANHFTVINALLNSEDPLLQKTL